jgi:hypothetical protein
MSERETVVELPWAADCCPCVEKLRTVLPFAVGIRDSVVHLVSILALKGGTLHKRPDNFTLAADISPDSPRPTAPLARTRAAGWRAT